MSTVYLGQSVLLGITLEFLVSFVKGDEQALAQMTFAHPPISLHYCSQQQFSVCCPPFLKSHLEAGLSMAWAHFSNTGTQLKHLKRDPHSAQLPL